MARDELLDQFLLEGRDLVARAVDDLAALSADGGARSALDGLFRSVHTLKGSAALFDLPALTGMLHGAENGLEAARKAGRLDEGAHLSCADALDLVEAWLDLLEADRQPPAELLARTAAVASEFMDQEQAEAPSAPAERGGWSEALSAGVERQGPLVAIRYRPASDSYFRGDDPLQLIRGVPGLLKVELSLAEAAEPSPIYDPFRCRLRIQALSSAPIAEVRAALRFVASEVELELSRPEAAASAAAGPLLRSVRVDADRLDALAALVDELVIAKNAVVRDEAADDLAGGRDRANARAALERVVTELHAAVGDLRLVELGRLFSRFPRQVREIAAGLGKEVEFVASGGSVALDKSVVESLYEPLLHLVRNALDHGLEPPAQRRASGKRERALVTLSARAVGEEITIELADDGRGLDIARIRRSAVDRGLISAEAAAQLRDDEAADLVFAPGFSTAGQVSELSGRGVGMDAVRTALARIGGRVSLHSRFGLGLTVRLSLPAQVVLTKVLTVKAGGESFGVPIEAVAELQRVRSAEVQSIRAGRAYVRRDVVTPLLRLTDLLGLEPRPDPDALTVINVAASGEPVGVQIDEIGERFDAPLRPLGGMLSNYPGVLGTVMRRDGQVLLVLDMAELTS